MGADRALLIEHNGPTDPWNVARLLAAVIEHEQPTLVLMGKQAVDDDANQTGQFLAAQLGWPQATFASQIEFMDDGLRVHRETDLGIEVIRITLPAIVTADLRLNEPRYASLPGILAARGKPIEEMSLEELGIEIEPRVELVGLQQVSSQRTGRRLENVTELLECLRENTELF